jgi:hypothetical protein
MNARGIVGLAAAAAIVVAGCSPDADASGELRDIREVLAEGADDPGSGDENTEPHPKGEVEGSADAGERGASAEAEGGEGPDPDIDITEVPDEITVEYVQAVVDELERIYAEAVVLMMEEGELTIEITDRIGEIFAVRQVDLRTSEFVDTAEDGFPGMRPPEEIETRRRIVQQILDQAEGCLYVETMTYDEAFFVDAVEPVEIYVLLESPTVSRPVDINSTLWVYGSLGSGERETMRGLTPCQD